MDYRLLAFWDKSDDKNTLVICTHGFIKKSQKTPRPEIKPGHVLVKVCATSVNPLDCKLRAGVFPDLVPNFPMI